MKGSLEPPRRVATLRLRTTSLEEAKQADGHVEWGRATQGFSGREHLTCCPIANCMKNGRGSVVRGNSKCKGSGGCVWVNDRNWKENGSETAGTPRTEGAAGSNTHSGDVTSDCPSCKSVAKLLQSAE